MMVDTNSRRIAKTTLRVSFVTFHPQIITGRNLLITVQHCCICRFANIRFPTVFGVSVEGIGRLTRSRFLDPSSINAYRTSMR